MKKQVFFSLFLLLSIKIVCAQIAIDSKEAAAGFAKIPQESVFVHLNSTLLLSGEYLYYAVYCFNKESNDLSELSKVAYVELLGKDGASIFKHKIRLNKGLGYADFFVPVSVPSGNYKLVAYTNWMLNDGHESVFISDINIINPYSSNEANLQTVKRSTDSVQTSKIHEIIMNKQPENQPLSDLRIDLEKERYQKRAKVAMIFDAKNEAVFGNYSVSVRKRGGIPKPESMSASRFATHHRSRRNSPHVVVPGDPIQLPELRGELLAGRVISKEATLAVNGLDLAVSIPGDHFFIAVAQTNNRGEFFVNIDSSYANEEVYIQVLGSERDKYEIELNDRATYTSEHLEFNTFVISPEWKSEILERSVHNQIENAYFEFKPDSLISIPKVNPFNSYKIETYLLDDYTRFSTLRQTMLEVIKKVSVRKLNDGQLSLELQGFDFGTSTGILPLVLVDGVVVQNLTDLLNTKATNFNRISVLRDQIVIGTKVFQGVVDIRSNSGIYSETQTNSEVFVTNLFKPQLTKNYFTQHYNETSRASRIPDDRVQLLWKPQLRISETETLVEFFTSDVKGVYDISLEGFGTDGQAVSLKKTFRVE